MLKYISKSQRIIGKEHVSLTKTTVIIPNMLEIRNKSAEELRILAITEVKWFSWNTNGFTLIDGQWCQTGKKDFTKSHTFDPTKKITRIDCIIHKHERLIIQIKFYHLEERLVAVGESDEWVNKNGGRVEIFSIADDEQLIGCELDKSIYGNFSGVIWIKMKVNVWSS